MRLKFLSSLSFASHLFAIAISSTMYFTYTHSKWVALWLWLLQGEISSLDVLPQKLNNNNIMQHVRRFDNCRGKDTLNQGEV